MVAIRPDEISSIIQKQIEDYDQDVKVSNVGTVLQVGDGIARVYGLEQAMAGELLEFEDGTIGIALNLEEDNVGAVLMGEGREIQEGSSVKSTGKIAQVPVGDAMVGRVVDALGRPIDGKGDINTSETRLIESGAPGIIERKSVCEPMQTGITSIDAMIPVGRGQRELIIGDRQTGKNRDRHRHHPQPEERGCDLCLCGGGSKSLHRGSSHRHFGRQRRHGLHHRRRCQRL